MTEILLAIAIAITPAAWQDPETRGAESPAPVAASAQDAVVPPKATMAPVDVAPTALERQARRDNLSIMEALLASAVRIGARQVLAANPGMTIVATGQPRARGFVLEGYGVFFDVEIPELNGSVELTLQQFQREYEKRLGDQAPSTGPKRAGQGLPAVVDDPDPGASYRVAVISAVGNVMLDYTKNLELKPNEWLTVALRGSELQLTSNDISDPRTVILRVKGSDLSDFLASRISRDEAIKRVEKREF